jgi:hypothetical protein
MLFGYNISSPFFLNVPANLIVNSKLIHTLILVLATGLAILGVSFFIHQGQPIYMLILAALVATIYLVNKPTLLLTLIILTYHSGLKIPGIADSLTLSDFLLVFFVLLALAGQTLRKTGTQPLTPPQLFIILFMVLLLVIMALRGAGFRFLGDDQWGGFRYISIFLGGMFYVSIRFIKIDSKTWIKALRWMLLLGTLPLLAEMIFLLSRGTFHHHYIFFTFSGSTLVNFMDFALEGEGVRRLQTALMTGEALMLFSLAFLRKPGRGKSQIIFWIFLFSAGLLMAVSGHRIAILRLLGVTWLYFWFCCEGKRSHYFTVSICFCLTSLLLLYLTAPFLPLAAQRMLAILPGVDIDPIAKLSADSTSEWRLTLWLDAIKQVPEYLILGKGFTFSGNIWELLAMAGGEEYVRMWALETSAYHNGILSLLICTGLPGLVLGTAFLVCGLLRYHRLANTFKKNPSLHAIWAALFSSVLVTVILYFTVYGDVFVSFPSILFYFSLLEGLYYTCISSGKTDSLDHVPSRPADVRPHLAPTNS